MLSFLHGVLQVYLEFWNSSSPFEEYVLNFTNPSRCVQDECAYMITEIISLLNHIRIGKAKTPRCLQKKYKMQIKDMAIDWYASKNA